MRKNNSNASGIVPEVTLNEAFDEALRLARQAASEDEVPVGAVVLEPFTDGEPGSRVHYRILGRGYNQREKLQDPLSHAELEAIRNAAAGLESWRLEKCVLVVTLEPCPMCLAACQQARLAQVYYGAEDPKGGALSLGYKLHEDARMHHRFSLEYAPRPECGEILTQFFSAKRKRSKS
jgi:tRNA(adenine34) deaminase